MPTRPARDHSPSSVSGGAPSGTISSAPSPREDIFPTGQYIGMTTELEPLLLDYLSLDHNGESPLAASRVRKCGDDGPFMRIVDGSQVGSEPQTISIDAIENLVTPFGPTLVDKFFQH